MVKGLAEEAGRRIVQARLAGGYTEVQQLLERAGLDRRELGLLASAAALRPLAGDRHRARCVITSYSIHYTKLYEAEAAAAASAAARSAVALTSSSPVLAQPAAMATKSASALALSAVFFILDGSFVGKNCTRIIS